jgi:NADP-dependent 3-hydroxy acid dehydrogenase YdfG
MLSTPTSSDTLPEIAADTGFTPELLLMDMTNFSSVSAFATAFQDKYERLDILLCNAGVSLHHYEPTKDGHETTFVTTINR